MKYLTLIPLFIFCLNALSMTPEERAIRRAQLRQQMHDKMVQGILDDPEKLMRQMDSLMDELMRDSLSDIHDLRMKHPNLKSLNIGPRAGVTTEWSEDKTGRVLTVIAVNKETKMDVQVLNGIVTIKTEQNSENFHNEMSRTQLVPGDCDGNKVKMEAKDGALVLHFPWKDKTIKPLKDERKPIRSDTSEVDV